MTRGAGDGGRDEGFYSDPAPIRTGGPSGRVIAGAMVLAVAFIAVALVKPWEERSASEPSPAPYPTGPSSVTDPSPTTTASDSGRLDLSFLDGLLPPRTAWGVRGVVIAPLLSSGSTPAGSAPPPSATIRDVVTEYWAPFRHGEPARRGADGAHRLVIAAGGRALSALGVTAPAGTSLDIRVWRERGGEVPERVPIVGVSGILPSLEPLYRPVVAAPSRSAPWRPGRYRIDVLSGGRIERLSLLITGDSRTFRADRPVSPPSREHLAEAARTLGLGPFVVDGGGRVSHVDVRATVPMDEVESWQNDRVDFLSRPGVVGHASVDRVQALGFVFARGEFAPSVRLTRIAPDGATFDDAEIVTVDGGTGHGSLLGGDVSYALFRPEHGTAWPAGVYRMEATWTGRDGRKASWHIDVVTLPLAGEPGG